MNTKVIRIIAMATAALSVVSWIYRFNVEYTRPQDLPFYVLVPAISWLLFAGPLFLLVSKKVYLRILAILLLIPFTLLWIASVLVGFYGLKIH